MPTPDSSSESLYDCLNWQTKKEISISQQSNNYVRIYSVKLKKNWGNGSLLPELTESTKVAMKEITRGTRNFSKTEICKKEFERLKGLSHDNIVIVYDAFLQVDSNDPSSLPSYLMEIGECSLSFVIRHTQQDSTHIVPARNDCSTQDPATNVYYTKQHLFGWLKQLASALLYLHNQNLIHRDVKGENALLFDNKTTCKLCDFDTCRQIDPEGMTPKVGTDRWRAPELRKSPGEDRARYNKACDAYSFGVLICEAVFREKPFSHYQDSAFTAHDEDIPDILPEASVAMLIKKGPNEPIVAINESLSAFENLPDSFWEMLKKLLSWSPERRPCFEEIYETLAGFSCSSDRLPAIIVSKVGQRTDTGTLAEAVIPSRRRRPLVTKRVIYSLTLDLEPDDQENLKTVLRGLSERINVHAAVPNDHLNKVHHEYSFQQPKELIHDIKSADQQLVDQVFESCTGTDKKFSSFLDFMFTTERNPRLRHMKFSVCSEQLRVED